MCYSPIKYKSNSLNCSTKVIKCPLPFYNGDLQLISAVDQLPHLEVPYPLTNGGQQLRYASGRCPVHLHPVTYIS